MLVNFRYMGSLIGLMVLYEAYIQDIPRGKTYNRHKKTLANLITRVLKVLCRLYFYNTANTEANTTDHSSCT